MATPFDSITPELVVKIKLNAGNIPTGNISPSDSYLGQLMNPEIPEGDTQEEIEVIKDNAKKKLDALINAAKDNIKAKIDEGKAMFNGITQQLSGISSQVSGITTQVTTVTVQMTLPPEPSAPVSSGAVKSNAIATMAAIKGQLDGIKGLVENTKGQISQLTSIVSALSIENVPGIGDMVKTFNQTISAIDSAINAIPLP